MTHLSRRSITAALGSALMAGSAMARHRGPHPDAPRTTKAPPHARWRMGLQLWTVNAEMKANPVATLKAVKALGFETVETAGLYGMSAATLRTHIEDAGLACKSYHAGMADLIASPEAHMANARTLGAAWIVCASPRTPGPLDPSKPWLEAMYSAMTLDAWKQNAAHLAELAPLAQKSGLTLAYHNHPMEFRDWNGVTGYSLLAGSSDALRFELDIGWVVAGGHDPLPILRQYAGRIDLLHVKDMIRDASAPLGWRSVEIGRGAIGWGPVMAMARATGVKGYFVEQEPPYLRPVMESLRISAEEIRRSKSFR